MDIALPDLMGHRVVALGVDAVEIDRIRHSARRDRFQQRLFTPEERAYALAAVDPAPRFAVRFAAKEATMKALGTGLGGINFTDVAVYRLDSGEPQLVVNGRAAQRAEERGIDRWIVTLTHSDVTAVAVVAGLQL